MKMTMVRIVTTDARMMLCSGDLTLLGCPQALTHPHPLRWTFAHEDERTDNSSFSILRLITEDDAATITDGGEIFIRA